MIKIFIIGTGNLGHHLCRLFDAGDKMEQDSAFAKARSPKISSQVTLVGYLNKKGASVPGTTATQITDYKDIPDCDLILIAVPDDRIKEVAYKIPLSSAIVAHTSGTVAMDVLHHHDRCGVFYLPQSFTKAKVPDLTAIPVCLEASDHAVMQLLQSLAQMLSQNLVPMDSQQRKELHLAAVYMNNFVNHCYVKSHEILIRSGIPTTTLDHLMRETLEKALTLTPALAQTGPAQRKDQNTIAAHLKLLPENERDLYTSLTLSIQNNNPKNKSK
jgi:predicted short-subunit dehydrogenase-like oxidoreductase (DUF2520 family)